MIPIKINIIIRQIGISILILVVAVIKADGQSVRNDSLHKKQKFQYQSLIIPTLFVGYGIIGIESDGIKSINSDIKVEVDKHIYNRLTIDNYTQYAPLLSVYGLNAIGIKGKNDFINRTMILASSYILMSSTVVGLKSLTKITRPDGSTNNSFPSGHTSTAFMGAEFIWQEYKDVSAWYGITGYLVAIGTGVLRIYNNRHWLTDVVAGAGIGILSTKIAYLINPLIHEKIFKGKSISNGLIMPFINGKGPGIGLTLVLSI